MHTYFRTVGGGESSRYIPIKGALDKRVKTHGVFLILPNSPPWGLENIVF